MDASRARGPGFLAPVLLGLGGLALVFGSCEAMIKCVEALGERQKWNDFVAGTMAGLASNVPEIIMLGFVVAAAPRVAFVVTCLTLHVNALIFGVYSALLPKNETGHALLPSAITKLGADLLACAAGVFLALGTMMLTLKVFDAGDHRGEGLGRATSTPSASRCSRCRWSRCASCCRASPPRTPRRPARRRPPRGRGRRSGPS